jgi:hypothetical protein
MTGTIVSGHTVANCIGVVTSLGFNLEDGDSCGLDPTAGDLINLDPLLGSLVPQGGPTPVRSLGAGSPAVDAGGGADFPPFDQRGVARPIDGDVDGRALPDLGAVEQGSVVVFADGFEDGGLSAWSAVAPGP